MTPLRHSVKKMFFCLKHRQFAGNETSRRLCPKSDRKACMYCLAGPNDHFQSQTVVSQPPHCLLSSQTILACFAIALWVHLGPIPLSSFCYRRTVEVNCTERTDKLVSTNRKSEGWIDSRLVQRFHDWHRHTKRKTLQVFTSQTWIQKISGLSK